MNDADTWNIKFTTLVGSLSILWCQNWGSGQRIVREGVSRMEFLFMVWTQSYITHFENQRQSQVSHSFLLTSLKKSKIQINSNINIWWIDGITTNLLKLRSWHIHNGINKLFTSFNFRLIIRLRQIKISSFWRWRKMDICFLHIISNSATIYYYSDTHTEDSKHFKMNNWAEAKG